MHQKLGHTIVLFKNNGWLMENMDKGLTVPKWVLINRPKFPKTYLPKLSAEAQKFAIQWKKASWPSIVRGGNNCACKIQLGQLKTFCQIKILKQLIDCYWTKSHQKAPFYLVHVIKQKITIQVLTLWPNYAQSDMHCSVIWFNLFYDIFKSKRTEF